MLTDPKLRSQVDQLWDKLWTGGLTNPMDAIEQFSYLLFLKRLDDEENQAEKLARLRSEPFQPREPVEMRWSTWTKMQAADALKHVREQVFPWLKEMGATGSSFQRYMGNAEFKINKANLLIEACKSIDQMNISAQNQDVQGDLYEYLLSYLNVAGRNGQFRTPRHIVRMMVKMVDPKPHERVGDLAGGTCGFGVNAYQHVLETYTSPDILTYDADDWPHNLVGDLLSDEQRRLLQTRFFRAYDNDSGMTMLRIGSMNLMLHGVQSPRFFYMDTLSKAFDETAEYDVITMNPPFKGAVDKDDVHGTLPGNTTKSELLFVHLILRALDMGGRCAVIVPDGVLFGSSTAHRELRQKLVESNRLDGVVSMPGGVFKPYAGVSTAVLFFTKGATTERIWFYDMAHDGFSLDDKRQPVAENDIPDILACWRNRQNAEFLAQRQARLEALQAEVAPLKAERLSLHGEINRLTFESVIAANGDEPIHAELEAAKEQLARLAAQIAPLQREIDQLSRQFWVTKAQVKANGYDLTASRYRQVEQDEAYYEKPQVTMERLRVLDRSMERTMGELENLLK
ncbi:MAG TPA: N-6 DNA methylase [Anaerolineae bacterium]|nr:N-6 DNA methylase [Anaerolineae bacterium]